MSRASNLIATLLVAVVCGQATAEEPATAEAKSATVEKTWTDAKVNYRAQLQKLSDEVLARVASLEKKARENGDLARVKQYKTMADAFSDRGELPSVVNRADFDRKRKRMQDDLRREAKLVIAAYLKDNRDTDAEDLNQELNDILTANEAGVADDTSAPSSDDLRKRFINVSYANEIIHVRGKQWEQIDPKTKARAWWLTETARDGKYIYVHCAARKEDWRIGEKRVDLLQPDKSWTWLSNGYWEAASDR